MIIEVILIVLGVLTGALGIWNMIVGAYVWGSLFLIGGIWSVWLGVLYIIQDRKAKVQEQAAKSVISAHSPEETTQMAVDDGILTQDLFAAGYGAEQASRSDTAVLDDIVEQVEQTQGFAPNNTMGLPPGVNPYAPNPNGYYGYPQNGAMAPGGVQNPYQGSPMGQPGPYINQVPGFTNQGQIGTGSGPGFGQPTPLENPNWQGDSVQETTVVLETEDSKMAEANAAESDTITVNQTAVAEATTDQTVIFEPQAQEPVADDTAIAESIGQPLSETQLEFADTQTNIAEVEEPTQDTIQTTSEMETIEEGSKTEEETIEAVQASTPKTHAKAPIFFAGAQKKAANDQSILDENSENEAAPVLEPIKNRERSETETGFVFASADEQKQDNDYTPMSNNGDVIFLGGEIQPPDESQTD